MNSLKTFQQIVMCHLIIFYESLVQTPCGEPGVPNNGYIEYPVNKSWTSKGHFIPGTVIHYFCNSGSLLFGDPERQCFHKGFWDNKVPQCAQSVTIPHLLDYTKFNLKFNYRKDDIIKAIDGDINTCFSLHSKEQQPYHSLELVLKEELHIKAIRLSFSGSDSENITSDDYSLWIGSIKERKFYGIPKTKNESEGGIDSYMHLCHGLISGDSLRLNYANSLNTSNLCQIDLFSFDKKDGLKCGSPDIPHNGFVKTRFKDNHLFAEFNCNQNYSLVGTKDIKCETNGLWSALSPICSNSNQRNKTRKLNPKISRNETKTKAKTFDCIQLTDENGRFSFTNGLNIGSHAILHCNIGFKASSKSVSLCLSTGVWSHLFNESLKCIPIECDFIDMNEIPGIKQIIVKKSNEKLFYSSEVEIRCNNYVVFERICGINGFWVKRVDINNRETVSVLKNLCQTNESLTESEASKDSSLKTNISLNSLIIISSIAAITTTTIVLIIFAFIRYLKRKLNKLNTNIANRNFRRVLPSVPGNDFSIIQIKHNYGHNRRRSDVTNSAYNMSYYGSDDKEVETRFSSSVLFNSGRKTSIIHTYSEPIDFDLSGQHMIEETSEENIYSEPYSTAENDLYSYESKCFE